MASRPGVPLPPQVTNLVLLPTQVAVILAAARVVGYLFRALHQPQVVGEIVAGICLGPSLLGAFFPGIEAALFPASSLPQLDAVSQIGLIVLMFNVGLHLNPVMLREHGHVAIVTSHVSIAAPFLLGSMLALGLYPSLAPPGVTFVAFALFMGAAMSVTAFPVLARILIEERYDHTPVGSVVLAAAAVDDVTAWIILAVVVMVAHGRSDVSAMWTTLAGIVAFLTAMMFVLRPLLRRMLRQRIEHGSLNHTTLAAVMLVALLSAATTDYLGIHALFGAFIAGAVMPKDDRLLTWIESRVEDFTVVLLLPLFFAQSGLRTSVHLLSTPEMWLATTAVLFVAVLGKLGGSAAAARISGMGWRESAAVGALMNTRGLMELVVLNIGLNIGVLSAPLFAMMVLMAVSTTLMTTPLLRCLAPRSAGA